MSIPENYRQLTRDQILTRFAGQERANCYVRLIRLEDPEPRLVYEGEKELYLMWSDYVGGRGGRARKIKAGEPQCLALITVNSGGWAECVGDDIASDGDCVVEDYLMQLYAADGQGLTVAEQQQRQDAMVDSLIGAIAGGFGDLGVEAVQIGDLLIPTVSTDTAGSPYIVQPTGKSFCPNCGQPVDLLCRDDGGMDLAFYICFACRWIGQVGVGPVPRLDSKVASIEEQ